MNDIPNPAIRFLRIEYDGYERAMGISEIAGSFPSLDAAISHPVGENCTADVLDTWTGLQWEYVSGLVCKNGSNALERVHTPFWRRSEEQEKQPAE